jgi:endonuclease G
MRILAVHPFAPLRLERTAGVRKVNGPQTIETVATTLRPHTLTQVSANRRPTRKKGPAASRRGRWVLPVVALGVLVLAAGVGVRVFWERLEAPTRDRLEDGFAGAVDAVREAPGVPLEVRQWLDALLDRVPAHVGPLVEANWPGPRQVSSFGGQPQATDGREIRVLGNRAYDVGWDVAAGVPAWVTYRVFRTEGRSAPPRPEGFRVDPRLENGPVPTVYHGSDFDRGHLAPNYAIGLCYGPEAQAETFWMTNVVPQRPALNRGRWRALEGRVMGRLTLVLETVWVTVGPLYEGVAWRRTLPGGPPIPDAFFAVLLDERPDGRVRALALRLPQGADERGPWQQWLTSVNALETESDLDFFPTLSPEAQSALEQRTPPRFW